MSDDKKEYSLLAKCIAEACGTFAIVAGGCGAVAANRYAGGGVFGAAAFGGSVMIGAYSTREISGAHLNPAVTAACVATDFPGKCEPETGAAYVASQCIGAVAACAAFLDARRACAASSTGVEG